MIKIPAKKKRKRITKYGEPIRKFGKPSKDYIQKWKYAFKLDANKQNKRLKKRGYLVRQTPIKSGWALWIRETSKSKKYEKEMFKQ